MIRAVFDTNVLVSYLLTHRPPIATLVDVHLRQEDFQLITAHPLLVELERVLTYPKIKQYLKNEEHIHFLSLIAVLSEIVTLPHDIPKISRDPDDDLLVACAVVGEANVLVSGDQDLLTLKQVGQIHILTPTQFLDSIKNSDNSVQVVGWSGGY